MALLHHVLAPALLAAATVPSQSRPAPKAKAVLSTCDLRGVSIDDGPLRQQIDEARAFYLRIPDDDLLKGFRARAGRPAPGADLGGWYSSDTFHVFGQIVSGLARLHAATGDPACREKVMALVRGFSECIAADGYGYASSRPNAPHYTYDKLVGGLVDAQLYCGDAAAAPALRRITDQAERQLARDRKPGDTSTEWYTLTENLLRAHLATGEERYRSFAAVWEYPQWWNLFPERRDLFAPPAPARAYHAYSHVNTLGGAGARWLVELQIGTSTPRAFTLRFRTPAWLAAPLRATVNGAPAEVTAGDRHWTSLARTWSDGDRVVVTLPMQLAAVPLPGDRPLPAAMMFGPVVLAVRAGSKTPHEAIDLASLQRDLVPSADEPLTWHARSDPGALVRPFFAFREGERYVMYLDPALARRIPHEAVAFQGVWQHGGRFRYCDVPGVTAECSFTGTGVRWLGFRFDDAGKAEVEIDGKVVAVVDQFGPGRDLPFDWKWDGLASGEHRLRLRLLPDKTVASKGRFLNVAGFEGLGGR